MNPDPAATSRLQRRVLGVSLVVIVAHAVDAAYRADRAPALATVIVVGIVVSAALAFGVFSARGRTVRSVIAGSLGLAAAAIGVAVGVHVVLAGASGADYTGLLLLPAGIALIGLAVSISLRGRRRRSWLILLPVGFAAVQWVFVPVVNAGLVTSAPRPAIAAATTLGISGARDVAFPARDGVRLAGWYVPGTDGAAIVLMHGSHGTRADALEHLRMLHRAGYAVLAFDARGHGQSHGQTNALGWHGDDDVAGAVTFLRHQSGIDPRRIAALGLSMGAEEALRAAADGIALRAIVADGAGASTMGDQHLIDHGITQPVFLSVTWLTMRATELLSGDPEPRPLQRLVGRIHVPVLLIASNAPGEHMFDSVYRTRIGANAHLWYLPDTGHTQALTTHSDAYRDRVTGFLATALGRPDHESTDEEE